MPNVWKIIDQPRTPDDIFIRETVTYNGQEVATSVTFPEAERLIAGDAADDDQVEEHSVGGRAAYTGKKLREVLKRIETWERDQAKGGA